MADEAKKNKLDLNVPTLAAGAAATVTMSVGGSYLGSWGTLTGAALTSVASAVVGAVYKKMALDAHEKARKAALERLRGRRPVTEEERAEAVAVTQAAIDAGRERASWTPRKLAVTGAAVAATLFGGVALAETGVEALAGKPVAAIVQGKPGRGTTFGGGSVGPVTTPTPAGTVEPSASPRATAGSSAPLAPVVTPSARESAPVTVPPVPPVLPTPSAQTSTAPPPGGAEPSSG